MRGSGVCVFGLALPGVGGALLAKLACPMCWPMFAGVLGALGVAGAEYASVGVPLGLLFLALALGSLAYRARVRRGYAPLGLGLLGAGVLLAGELALERESLAIAGVGLLIAASLWNAWPRRMPGVAVHCAASPTSAAEMHAES